jgi:fumarylacetoacetase
VTGGTDATHDPGVTSWVDSANGHPDFPIQNLPLGIFRRRGSAEPFRVATAIGDAAFDLGACAEHRVLDGVDHDVLRACAEPSLNTLMALEPQRVAALRRAIHATLRADTPRSRREGATRFVIPQGQVELALPARIGDYTDFFASIHHATRVGALFKPANPLAANYKHVPAAYHGRASTVVVSGTEIPRPHGQLSDGKLPPVFGPTRHLDYELEVGFFIGQGNAYGTRIPVSDARRQVFGCCLLNDWSARDIQWWESVPLGPFLAKSFATTISPWVVLADALAPFRVPAAPRDAADPQPLPYLCSEEDQRTGLYSIDLEVRLGAAIVARSNFASAMYWTPAQMIAHHTANGCSLRPGDLIGSGTASGPEPGSEGCLLERTRNGLEPLVLDDGARRTFLEDGDEVVMRGTCSAPRCVPIGFGECRGRIGPATAGPDDRTS